MVLIKVDFTSSPGTGGALTIIGGSVSGGLSIDSTFTGVSTVINNRTFYLGQSFTNGIANPEVAKFSGEIIYVDNRPNVTRSTKKRRHQGYITILIGIMSQITNLNVAPYYDDFDPTDNYHRVLFKPGYPVQARELTSLQSILQNQIERFGQHFF